MKGYTTERPRESGYYLVIWEEFDESEKVYITYWPAGTLFKDDYWTWGHFEDDDPESLEADVREPGKIQFMKLGEIIYKCSEQEMKKYHKLLKCRL